MIQIVYYRSVSGMLSKKSAAEISLMLELPVTSAVEDSRKRTEERQEQARSNARVLLQSSQEIVMEVISIFTLSATRP